ncbi:hypothetical protein HOK68_01000 [Candidatus Woesearchaeota archaeon]|jgi:hypothetical protein|nr:hypothetical protein [Candidatus Woesearchaeota archaeon]MBT4387694.1 hypothetical protein [Candidatus Woesearchaeota archaeon]MBT4595944.1 hypothetical protein [Candidatus Woesearchaeota archaeon]MBT5741074.1 hypothetical protein [Candidatus Woesearchaeota archaeon]MBT6505338.1 hypothetical protein [Candidatus Woesearchaeota archaeon]
MAWLGFLITITIAFFMTSLGFLTSKKLFKLNLDGSTNTLCSILIALISAISGIIFVNSTKTSMVVSFLLGVLISSYLLVKKLNCSKQIATKTSVTAIIMSYFFAAVFITIYKLSIIFI